jgi:hypothetical protein
MYRTRDWRRAQKSRFIKRVVNFQRFLASDYQLPNSVIGIYSYIDEHGIKHPFHSWVDVFNDRSIRAKYQANNRTLCSGPCCGNPRRWYGELTRQEIRHAITCSEVM